MGKQLKRLAPELREVQWKERVILIRAVGEKKGRKEERIEATVCWKERERIKKKKRNRVV